MLIVANWKAYVEELAKAKKLFEVSKKLSSRGISIVLAPSAPFLGALALRNKPASPKTPSRGGSKVVFAAQDVSATTGGANTGEITAQVYAAAGATYAIIGHSERRSAGDTYAIIADKLAHALAHGLIPILCVGEKERDSEGQYLAMVREELTAAIQPLEPKERSAVIVAYEPVWAIGKTADAAIKPNDLAEMTLYIRKVLAELLPGKSSAQTTILYGGSVEPGDIRDLAGASGIDGFLVGHASVDPQLFSLLIKQLA